MSGFLVPPMRVTASSLGCVHQFVAPTSRPGAHDATVSVSDGTRDTTRLTAEGTGTGRPRSSTGADAPTRPVASLIAPPRHAIRSDRRRSPPFWLDSRAGTSLGLLSGLTYAGWSADDQSNRRPATPGATFR